VEFVRRFIREFVYEGIRAVFEETIFMRDLLRVLADAEDGL
jgi:hypothetical protein